MCSDAANGEYEGFKVNSEIGCSWEGEATTSESRFHLNDILEMLIRLDQQGFFMNPVDDSIAPDYSKVIKKPMCFLRMREKIYAEQYTSWFSFVEDFERICYNAMNYNQRQSRIWNAANLILHQGKRCLEQQFSRHTIILGLNKMSRGYNHQEKAKVLGSNEVDVQPCGYSGGQTYFTTGEYLVPSVKDREEQITPMGNSTVSEMDGGAQRVAICSPANNLSDDVPVEILRPAPEEDFRLICDGQTTECSSSFSGTQSELDDESSEVDSELRDGNGASAPTEYVSVTSGRKKKALDIDWKMYRQGIEWRCRWLELRIQKLQAVSNKYSRILKTAQTHKGQRQQDGSVARTSDMGSNTHRRRVLRRRRRRRTEECFDSMSLHPVFSRYEKQKQHNQDMSSNEEGGRNENHQVLEFDDFDLDFQNGYEDYIVLEKDSIEQYLWQIEALQMQISNLQDQLIRGPTVPENPPKLTSELEAPQNTALSTPIMHSPIGLGGRSATRELKGTPSRRRNSDFDINNVIMPDSVMANYVEPARHAFIETPHWRLKAESAAQDEEESSDEDTDDELYKRRHAQMQAQERKQQYSPLSLNKSRNVSTAKERPRSDTAGKGPVGNAPSVGDLQNKELPFPASLGCIPKRKRKKRESRESTATHTVPKPTLDNSET